ncbi:MarR family transcriptional regulator [Pontibacter diazotrophicus]|uniref:MarR family transcriptional regulator n=1 Tax=Pontibacter diazotrophicus TaxID=1400979 RepID=A0A3D8L236_9BACT|nr:helix-turn-helix domain-containing protein [Pontibacter diazotrophicus]RDV11484.1 MarR family transcriptional regulator [Pontibacter diazotrophicus]
MISLNRIIVLNVLIKHETLTIGDFAREGNLGMTPSDHHLQYLIDELVESGHISMLAGVTPCTYTITDKGIREGARLTHA